MYQKLITIFKFESHYNLGLTFFQRVKGKFVIEVILSYFSEGIWNSSSAGHWKLPMLQVI